MTMANWIRGGGLAIFLGLLLQGIGFAGRSVDEIDDLAKRIRKERDAVHPDVFEELAQHRNEKALEALFEGLDRLKDERTLTAAFTALRHFDGVEGLEKEALEEAYRVVVRGKKEPLRRIAAGSLIAFGDDCIPYLERILAKHEDASCRAVACNAMLPILAGRMGPESTEALGTILDHATLDAGEGHVYVAPVPARFGGGSGDVVHRDVLQRVLESATDERERSLLCAKLASPDSTRPWRLLLVEVLRSIEGLDVSEAIASLLGSKDPTLILEALGALSRREEWSGLERHLRPVLKSREPSLRRAALVALSNLMVTDPEWPQELLGFADDRDPALRMGAAHGLAELRTLAALVRLHGMLIDPDWSVRVEVLDQLGRLRRKESIPPLIKRLGKERGRFRLDVYAVLRHLTGLDLGVKPDRWEQWWAGEGERFEVPPAATAERLERERREVDPGDGTSAHPSFYGFRVVSERVCFVLDVSGSMRLQSGTENGDPAPGGGTGPTRMDVAKEQLKAALRGYPDGMLFNMIFFETEVRAWQKHLVKMKKSTRQGAMRWVHEQYALGSTALYPALKLAFEDELVDTIYLLTDGAPTEGEITDIREIRAEVRRWNSARHVVIHGITMGQDSTLLHWLTEDTGGNYTRID